MNWKGFREEAPALAAEAERLFELGGVVLVGTVRRDGGPRISPVEPNFVDGELHLGMMWQSLKALDLERDPRCTVHNLIGDRYAKEGEFKLHGRARPVEDAGARKRFADVVYAAIQWRPREPYHLFTVDLVSAGLFLADGNRRQVKRWRQGEGVKEFFQEP